MKDAIKSRFLVSVSIISCILGACSGVKSSSTGGSSSPSAVFTVGGTVSGLTGSGLVLQDNGGDSLAISANGSYTFKTAVKGAYGVTVLTQPASPAQLCSVTNGSGTATANVTNIQVACVLSYTIGGTVSGLVGTGLVLENNGGDKLSITGNGTFTFKTPIGTGSTYAVSILTQPSGPAQTCAIVNGSGTVSGNVTSVQVNCPAVTSSIGGSVVGLLGNGGGFELQDNAGDNLLITGNGKFTFATAVANGGGYNVSVFIQPTTQTQPCLVFNGSGVATSNVTNVIVDCGHNDWTWMKGAGTGNQYGTDTLPPPVPNTNTPGGRDSAATWTDASGNFWLFGGQGYDLAGKSTPDPLGLLNDLWEYNNGVWTLVGPFSAASNINVSGVYGIAGVAAAGNLPGGRWGGATWTDKSGNFWLLGGQGFDSVGTSGLLNDLWKYSAGQWTWVSGSNSANQKGVYGTKGVAAPGNTPGARWAAVTWVDASGNVWLFGGQGFDSTGAVGLLNDLWEFSGGQWVWIGGSPLVNQNGVYGTEGTAAASNVPGGRQAAAAWTDASGSLWLFGGFGLDSVGTTNGILNDMWKFSGGQWTWMAGSNLANQDGVYGTQGVAAAGGVPGSRWGSVTWVDAAGRLWLFGGWGLDATGTNGNGFLNDLWQYSGGQWTWVNGSNSGNQKGTYGALSVPYVNDVPGGRRGAVAWKDAAGNFWLFGGQGYDSTGTSGSSYLNDLWRYLPYP
jgi:hypothetical protein